MTLEFILRVVGADLVSIVIAIAPFRSRVSGPKNTANLVQTLDELLKKNQQLMKRNQHLLGEIGSQRNNPLDSNIPVEQVAVVRTKLVGPSEASTKMKAKKASRQLQRGLSHVFKRP